MTNQRPRQNRVWTVSEAKERLPELLHLAETEGPQRIVAKRTFILATSEMGLYESTEIDEPFEIDEAAELLRMDAERNPVLANYWGDDADDDLISSS